MTDSKSPRRDEIDETLLTPQAPVKPAQEIKEKEAKTKKSGEPNLVQMYQSSVTKLFDQVVAESMNGMHLNLRHNAEVVARKFQNLVTHALTTKIGINEIRERIAVAQKDGGKNAQADDYVSYVRAFPWISHLPFWDSSINDINMFPNPLSFNPMIWQRAIDQYFNVPQEIGVYDGNEYMINEYAPRSKNTAPLNGTVTVTTSPTDPIGSIAPTEEPASRLTKGIVIGSLAVLIVGGIAATVIFYDMNKKKKQKKKQEKMKEKEVAEPMI